jgi:phage regulator Rha-like protein
MQDVVATVANGNSGELRMSSREIAALTGKQHKHVKADIEKMLAELEKDAPSFRRIYLDSMNRQQTEYLLPERECLILASGYSVALRAAIIDHWLELKARAAKPTLPLAVTDLLEELSAKIDTLTTQVAEAPIINEQIIEQRVMEHLAGQSLMLRHGKTAGQIWSHYGFPKLKGGAQWLGNRLAQSKCGIDGGARAELGGRSARLFDPDKVERVMRAHLEAKTKLYVAERLFGKPPARRFPRQGQLRLVQ